MIRIGLTEQEKQREVDRYIRENGITQVKVFYPDRFPLDIDGEHVEYKDIIEYKFFYRLLEEIDPNTLLVFNECLRTQKRSDLTYNCAHHYCNQTPHKIVFEHFPFIEGKADFMILLDFLNKGKYKGKGFSWEFLQDEDVQVKPIKYTLHTIDVISPNLMGYERKKKQLFANLGNSEPDTIPRQLHVWTGSDKRQMIDPGQKYIARNARFKMPNVATYRDVGPGEYILLDFPHRRIDMNDFLKVTGMPELRFVNSTLKVDQWYINEFRAWAERLGEFYAQASIYQ